MFALSSSLARATVLVVVAPAVLAAQQLVCPTGITVPYFGWNATDCGNCNVYGSYLEYLTEPKVSDIRANGPADGKLREHDTLVSVDGMAITTPVAWHRLRDAWPGDSLRFGVRRDGREMSATVIAGARCGQAMDRGPATAYGIPRRAAQAGSRTFTLDGVVVQLDGRPDDVQYDERTKTLVINVDGVVVRVRSKP